MNKLIIAEKPSVAVRLALSLADDGKPKRGARKKAGRRIRKWMKGKS